MDKCIADQVAALLNDYSGLTLRYSGNHIQRRQDEYIVTELYARATGAIRVERVSWYQSEISHLVVHPDYRNQGLSRSLVEAAEIRAMRHGSRIVQCTIQANNLASRNLFTSCNYHYVSGFMNPPTGHILMVFQKTLRPTDEPRIEAKNSD